MPRPLRVRKPKEPKAPITYELSDEVNEVAATLFAKHETHFWSLRPFKIGYVLIFGARPPKDRKVDTVARFVKTSGLWKSLTGYDAVVWVKSIYWNALSATQREALLAHELSHGATNDKGELIIEKHDLEEFAWVARQSGAWSEGIEVFGKQLNLFGTPEPPTNGAAKPEPAAVADAKAPTPIRPRRSKAPPVVTA
jgi:hypothetical protein